MRIPKRYGESKIEKCPFCGIQSTTSNSQGVPVCRDHKDQLLPDMKCVCGEYLDMKKGKFGVFFTCFHCGAINLRKALDMNNIEIPKIAKKKETTVRSDDPLYF